MMGSLEEGLTMPLPIARDGLGGECKSLILILIRGHAMEVQQNRTEQITWPQPARLITLSTLMWVLLQHCHCVPHPRERSCISRQNVGQFGDHCP